MARADGSPVRKTDELPIRTLDLGLWIDDSSEPRIRAPNCWVFETSLRENSLLENAFVGQLVGPPKNTPQLGAEELSKLKRLLSSI